MGVLDGFKIFFIRMEFSEVLDQIWLDTRQIPCPFPLGIWYRPTFARQTVRHWRPYSRAETCHRLRLLLLFRESFAKSANRPRKRRRIFGCVYRFDETLTL